MISYNISDVKCQNINKLHKPARQNFRRRGTIIKGYADLCKADILEVETHANKNSGYRYILIVFYLF